MDKYLTKDYVISLEKIFSQNRYDGDLKSEQYFKYIEGKIPFLVSSPHSTNHITKNGQFKMSDTYTGSIAIILGKLTGSHIIYMTKQHGKNPNADEIQKCDYKRKVKEIVKENNVKYILDLHVAAKNRSFDIDLGTNYGNSMKKNIETIKNIAKKFNLSDVRENDTFKADGPNNVTKFCSSNLGIESIQLEINKKLRDPINDIQSFKNLIIFIKEVIMELNES